MTEHNYEQVIKGATISRVNYFINIIFYTFLCFAVKYGFDKYIFGAAKQQYAFLLKLLFYFIIFVLIVNILMLIDKRIYHISGSRDAKIHAILSNINKSFITVFFIWLVTLVVSPFFKYTIPQIYYTVMTCVLVCYMIYMFTVGLIPGKKI